jgi:hypothetical protein
MVSNGRIEFDGVSQFAVFDANLFEAAIAELIERVEE